MGQSQQSIQINLGPHRPGKPGDCLGCRFGFDVLTGLWLVADLYPGFEPERLPAVLEQLTFVWSSLGEVLDAALKGEVVDETALDAAFELEPDGRPN